MAERPSMRVPGQGRLMRLHWSLGSRRQLPPEPPPDPPPPEPPPPLPPDEAGYTSSREHLWDELRRADILVRGQVQRWRRGIGETKHERLWGMPNVSDAEVAGFLGSEFAIPLRLDDDETYREEAARLARAIQVRLGNTSPALTLRLAQLTTLFGLQAIERDLLLAGLLPELDGRYRRVYGYLDDDVSRRRPSVELLLQIANEGQGLAGPGRDALLAQSPLVAFRLLVLGSDDEPLAVRPVGLDRRVIDFLLDGDVADARVASFLGEVEDELDWDALRADPDLVRQLRSAADWWMDRRLVDPEGATALLCGPDGSGRLAAAQAFCTETALPLLVADAAAVGMSGVWAEAVDLIYREAILRGAALYWRHCEVLLRDPAYADRWDYLSLVAERAGGMTFLSSEIAWDPVGRFQEVPYFRFVFPMPDFVLRTRIWHEALPSAEDLAVPDGRDALAVQLAAAFRLTDGQVQDAVAAAVARSRLRPDRLVTSDDLLSSARRQSSRLLGGFGRRIEPAEDIDEHDLILPEPNRRQLDELRQRIRLRPHADARIARRIGLGRGLVALFTGSSGTGKTMAAELLAKEQGVDLFKIDLSAVVSKYVGETEKQLRGAFDEAENTNAILFFDEADAIFGKRGEVRTAQDRWANMEVNYLLQRVEEYSGVVILATNLRQNIDEAFLRRIQFQVEFPAPDGEARFRILERLLPAEVQRPPDVDLQSFARRFELSGGNLKNIVVDAIFRAYVDSGDEVVVRIEHLVAATAREYQKLGRPITKSEFGTEFFDFVQRELLSPTPPIGVA
jgi:hypothetical protein